MGMPVKKRFFIHLPFGYGIPWFRLFRPEVHLKVFGAIVMALLYAVSKNQMLAAGVVAGFAVHFKIYPIIYIPTVIWSLSSNSPMAQEEEGQKNRNKNININVSAGRNSIFPSSIARSSPILNFINWDRLMFGLTSLVSFWCLRVGCTCCTERHFAAHIFPPLVEN